MRVVLDLVDHRLLDPRFDILSADGARPPGRPSCEAFGTPSTAPSLTSRVLTVRKGVWDPLGAATR